jgi:dienelactone hydrolase
MSRAMIVAGFLVCAVCGPAPARADRLDGALRETVSSVPVPEAGAEIVVTSFRPPGAGRFPWLVLSHGTAPSKEKNLTMERYRPLAPVREWVRRGYAVIVPMRRGYGSRTAAHLSDDYGTCARPDFRRAGEAAALDLLAAANWAKQQGDLDPDHWLLVGQSAGGFASIYTAAKQPAGLVAVLAFSPGRGGNPDTRPGEPCASDVLATLFASIAPQVTVPVLWFYAENDQYIGPRVQRLWFDSFHAAGGAGDLVAVPAFPHARGHGVFPSDAGTPLWTAAVRGFFKSHSVAMPF